MSTPKHLTSSQLRHVDFGPFIHLTPKSDVWEILQRILVLILLVPSRALCLLACVLTFSLHGIIHQYIVSKVLCGRRGVQWSTSLFRFAGQCIARIALFALGFHFISIEGRKDMRCRTIVANHLSCIDILILMYIDFPAFLAKDCVLAIPFIGKLSRVFECLYVGSRPESPEQGEATTPLRVNHVSDAIVLRQDAMQQHDELPNLAIFPEGTTSNGLFLIPFRSGSFRSTYPVQPFLIFMPWERISLAWESIPFSIYFLQLVTQWHNRLSVRWLPPMQRADEESAPAMAERVRRVMADSLRVPMHPAGGKEKLAWHMSIRSGRRHWRWYHPKNADLLQAAAELNAPAATPRPRTPRTPQTPAANTIGGV